jgi:anthranilate synthase component 2
MKLLLIDNYDSFVHNLKQYLGELGAECIVRRNDALCLNDVSALDPDAIVISPGPGHPQNERDFGICRQVLQEISPDVPTLGVCLGHQGIATTFGAKVVRAPLPVHGKACLIEHDGTGLFAGLDSPMTVGRYHSLIAVDLPPALKVTACTREGLVMGLRHEGFPIEGVQFHPESVLTPKGMHVLDNFLDMAR